MNLKKIKDDLKALEEEFFYVYPKGFEEEKFQIFIKKYKPEKIQSVASEYLKKENFSNPNLIIEGFLKVVKQTVMVSFYDKLKLRDMLDSLSSYEKDMLSIEIYESLYGNKKEGFDGFVEFLAQHNLAKWTIVSVLPYALDRQNEYFIKPTTTKDIIKYFNLDLKYKPKPSFEFYEEYKKFLDELKVNTPKSLTFDNAAFTGYLRNAIKICED